MNMVWGFQQLSKYIFLISQEGGYIVFRVRSESFINLAKRSKTTDIDQHCLTFTNH